MPYNFKISQKFTVDLIRARVYYRYLESASQQNFWKEGEEGFEFRYKRGVYIFFTGSMPIYVGKAVGKQGFYQECFQEEKLKKLSAYFQKNVDRLRNNLKIMFIYSDMPKPPIKAGKDFCRRVKEMESYLIKLANRKNSNCKNDKDTIEHWTIEGFLPKEDSRRCNVGLLNSVLFEKE